MFLGEANEKRKEIGKQTGDFCMYVHFLRQTIDVWIDSNNENALFVG
jgi:hypothetical protein